MAGITIRNLDEQLKGRLRLRLASLGRSMEDEVRNILRAALEEPRTPTSNLAERMRRRFGSLGDVDLLPERPADWRCWHCHAADRHSMRVLAKWHAARRTLAALARTDLRSAPARLARHWQL